MSLVGLWSPTQPQITIICLINVKIQGELFGYSQLKQTIPTNLGRIKQQKRGKNPVIFFGSLSVAFL